MSHRALIAGKTCLTLVFKRALNGAEKPPPHRAIDEHKTGSIVFYQWKADYD